MPHLILSRILKHCFLFFLHPKLKWTKFMDLSLNGVRCLKLPNVQVNNLQFLKTITESSIGNGLIPSFHSMFESS